MDHRLEAAEIHISHLTRTVDELSEQVAWQADQIGRLNKRFQFLLDRVSKHDSGDSGYIALSEQRPPHW